MLARFEFVQGQKLSLRQISNMNVIADAAAVRCGVVFAKQRKRRPVSGSRGQGQGNDVNHLGMALAILAMRAGYIEVAQAGGGQVVGAAVVSNGRING